MNLSKCGKKNDFAGVRGNKICGAEICFFFDRNKDSPLINPDFKANFVYLKVLYIWKNQPYFFILKQKKSNKMPKFKKYRIALIYIYHGEKRIQDFDIKYFFEYTTHLRRFN